MSVLNFATNFVNKPISNLKIAHPTYILKPFWPIVYIVFQKFHNG